MLWVNDPMGIELVDRLHAPALYDITDDWTAAPRTPAEHERVVRQEQRLLAMCNEVVVCSADLARTKGARREVTVVPNGVDLAAYRQVGRRPSALPPGPVALYVGTLHRDRLDVELTLATARAVVGLGRLVVAGPIALPQEDVRALEDAGVVLLGPQDRSAVPGLLQHADLLVVPHVVSAFTESLDPIKLYEYAAAGRPVVSTPVAGFRDDRSGRVTIAAGDDFPPEVARALGAGWVPPVHRPEDETADWGSRVEQMATVLSRLETA
jgi:glycosyltransferase involved in cell wall biosynthesis